MLPGIGKQCLGPCPPKKGAGECAGIVQISGFRLQLVVGTTLLDNAGQVVAWLPSSYLKHLAQGRCPHKWPSVQDTSKALHLGLESTPAFRTQSSPASRTQAKPCI